MHLRPSQVFFSQDSISCMFDCRSSHSGVRIGDTLDNLCKGWCNVNSIPTISVMKREGRWVTADNRRLWVFRQLERLGKCDTIPVRETTYIPEAKFTSDNNGESIRVRGSPGGRWHLRPTVKKPTLPPTIKKSPAVIPYMSNNGVSIVSKSYSNRGFVSSESNNEAMEQSQTTHMPISQAMIAKRPSSLDNISTGVGNRRSSHEANDRAGSYNDAVRTGQIELEETWQRETGFRNQGQDTLGRTGRNISTMEQTENISIGQGVYTLGHTGRQAGVVDQTAAIVESVDTSEVNVNGTSETAQTTVSDNRLRPVVVDLQDFASENRLNGKNTICGFQRKRIIAFVTVCIVILGIIIVLAVVLGH